MVDTQIPADQLPGYAFVQHVLTMLVEDKNELVIDARVDDLGVLITVRVSARDMGKLIGKNGQTIKSIRTLLRVIGGIVHQRVNLKVLDPEDAPDSPLPLPPPPPL